MLDKLRHITRPRLLSAIVVVLIIGAVGSYVLVQSHALSPTSQGPSARLLQPDHIGTAPYQYIAYSGSLNDSRVASGVKQYIAAFIVSSSSCTPAWGGAASNGLVSQRSTDIATDITNLRAAGGDVTLSFGGAAGTDLATSCQTSSQLAAAYQSVIGRYGLQRVDFDIEGKTLADTAGNLRRAEALASLQKTNPNLKVWVTLPVQMNGLISADYTVLRQLQDQGVVLSGINIMTMNFGVPISDMASQAISTASAAFKQIQALYPNNSASQIWQTMGMTVMIGRNNTLSETFTLDNARTVEAFAASKGIGLLSMWNAGRDMSCADSATVQPSISCSGVVQQPYDFVHALTLPAQS
jgi:hypothetical protein